MRIKAILFLLISAVLMMGADACVDKSPVLSDTGITKASADIQTGIDGLTIEQRNVKHRLEVDNQPGSIKHLYVISSYTGQVLIYSTVDGKVSSSQKRLTPTSVAAADGQYVDSEHYGMPVNIGGKWKYTAEVLQDDGTYGSSTPYVFWFDTLGNYHQHYITGGQIFHVADAPLAIKDVVIRIGTVEE